MNTISPTNADTSHQRTPISEAVVQGLVFAPSGLNCPVQPKALIKASMPETPNDLNNSIGSGINAWRV